MKTLEEVKEHFKNAKEVKIVNADGFTLDISEFDIVQLGNVFLASINGITENENWSYCLKGFGDELAEIISYKDEYPKVMLVWDDEESRAVKRVVIKKTSLRYVAWNAPSIEESKEALSTAQWRHAKDLPTIKEVTLEEVAKKFNISVENLRIKE
jgi:hypothetical protein